MSEDFRSVRNEKVSFGELLNKQIDRVGMSSLIPEKVSEENGKLIPPPIDETIRGLLYLLYPYIEDKDEIKSIEWDNPGIKYWSNIMIIMMKWMKDEGMLMTKVMSQTL